MKKLLFLTPLFFIFIPSVFAASTGHFSDVKSTHPNFGAIEALADSGFIEGYADGTFKPSRLVARSELAAMIVRALEANPEEGRYKNCFDDMKKQWFAKYVCYGKSNRWLSGYPGTQFFRPGSNVIVVEALRMILDAFKVRRMAATEFLKRKWDVPFGYKNQSQTFGKPQWYEDYLVTARERGFLDITPASPAKMMNRAEIAEIIYRVMSSKSDELAPEGDEEGIRQTQSPFQPQAGSQTTQGASAQTPAQSRQPAACTLSIRKPSHIASFSSASYCAYDLANAHSTQIWISSAYLPVVWGQPYDFRFTNKYWAMSLAYASELFSINPNYLLAVAIKESHLNCNLYPDGCFQVSRSGFDEVKTQFPQYIDSSAEHVLVQKFETGAVIAALYFNFAENLLEKWYQLRNFYENAYDKEAWQAVMSRAYNRGLWDAVLKTILRTNRAQCLSAPSVLNDCFPQSTDVVSDANGIALDHAKAVTDYCRRLGQSTDVFDAQLTEGDIHKFIDETLKPTYSSSANVNFDTVKSKADAAFNCLKDANNTISFRHDFKILLREIFKILPAKQTPQRLEYSSP